METPTTTLLNPSCPFLLVNIQMPYRLRKAPKRDLYWVVDDTGKKYSKDPLPKERAEAQRRALYAAEQRGGRAEVATSAPPPPPPPPSYDKLKGKTGHYADVPRNRPPKQHTFSDTLREIGREDLIPPPIVIPPRNDADWDEGTPPRRGRGKMTHKANVLKKLGLDDVGHSVEELAEATGVPRKVLQEVYNRGIGAYKTNPTSVRMKGSYAKGVDAPMSKKLSKEQWAMARVYSFLDGNKSHDTDLRGSGPMPPRSELQPIASASYNPPPPQTIGNLKLLEGTGTLVFYKGEPNTIVVGIRGTVPSDTGDLKADASIVIGQLRSSRRFKQDLATLQQFQLKYPPSQWDYYGVGHSLGGAILDEFLKMGLIKKGVSYNPAVQPQTLFSKTNNERIYEKGDPLYQLIGRFTNPEVRDTQSKQPKSFLSKLPYLGKAYDYLQSHGLKNFVGGRKPHGKFEEQLHESGMDPDAYLRIARQRAKDAGLPYKLLGFADDEEHKLAIPNADGKMVKFGRTGYGDFILWSDAEARGEVEKGYAKKKRQTFQKSHRAIKGDWKKDPFSPNNLALKILW